MDNFLDVYLYNIIKEDRESPKCNERNFYEN